MDAVEASNHHDALDEKARPRPSGTVALTAAQQGPGEHLRMIHDHFRSEVSRLVRLVDQVVDDEAAIAELDDAVAKLSMRRNYEEFGTFCGLACRGVAVHHRIEDLHIFPVVALEERYSALIEKLKSEHDVIHEQLVAVDQTLSAFHSDNERVEPLANAIHSLQKALFSHLQYEDEQLPEPLGILELPV